MRNLSLKTTLIGPLLCLAASQAQALQININPDPDFNDSIALQVFQDAADTWGNYFTDNITVNIDASFYSFGNDRSNVIGSTSAATLIGNYDFFTDLLKADADADDAILAFLPSESEAVFNISSSGDSVDKSQIIFTRANLKAIGYTNTIGNPSLRFDPNDDVSDGSISFNSDFNFDFDNSDGVSSGLMDFESVAIHEIGHLLGFISTVDGFDQSDGTGSPTVLDLFRFNADDVPLTQEEFTTTPRDLTPGEASVFSDAETDILLSTGVNLGDGRQASHFKDNMNLGIMDPTLAPGEMPLITENDLLAFDLIGYDRSEQIQVAAVPEPSSIVLSMLGALGFLGFRKRTS